MKIVKINIMLLKDNYTYQISKTKIYKSIVVIVFRNLCVLDIDIFIHKIHIPVIVVYCLYTYIYIYIYIYKYILLTEFISQIFQKTNNFDEKSNFLIKI